MTEFLWTLWLTITGPIDAAWQQLVEWGSTPAGIIIGTVAVALVVLSVLLNPVGPLDDERR
jgi:hypothetical protein